MGIIFLLRKKNSFKHSINIGYIERIKGDRYLIKLFIQDNCFSGGRIVNMNKQDRRDWWSPGRRRD